jgi:putative type IV pilin
MKKRKNKKGFTIVELVIVIAVIAILAAVLIPTFSSLIKKAKISADTQLAKNMNTALTMAEAEGNTLDNFTDVIEAIEKAGFIVANLNPTADGMLYVWEMESNQILMVDAKNGFEVVYQAKSLENTVIGETWFVICHDDETASAARNAGAVVTNISWQGDTHIAKDVDSFTDAVANARDGDAVIMSGELVLTNPLTIQNEISFVSYDNNAIVSAAPISIYSNVTMQNITFDTPENASKNASAVYVKGDQVKEVLFDGCTFLNCAWDSIQITSESLEKITIRNCHFENNLDLHETTHTPQEGEARESRGWRYIHIEFKNVVAVQTIITDNTFVNVSNEFVGDSAITIYGIPKANMVFQNNLVTGDGSDVLTTSQVWISDGLNASALLSPDEFTNLIASA